MGGGEGGIEEHLMKSHQGGEGTKIYTYLLTKSLFCSISSTVLTKMNVTRLSDDIRYTFTSVVSVAPAKKDYKINAEVCESACAFVSCKFVIPIRIQNIYPIRKGQRDQSIRFYAR